MTKTQKKDSSDSSIDDEEHEEYLDEQEDPMTDQQTQINNNHNQTSTVTANNTLPINKATGNATRSVIQKIVLCSSQLFIYFLLDFVAGSDEAVINY